MDPFFKMYQVSIPADLVEIVGAIQFSDLCDIEDVSDLCQHGKGRFSNLMLTPCKILEARRLTRPSDQPTEYIDTNTVKITFEGRLLPKHVEFNGLLIQVRPFYHKPMFCETCQSFGHTIKFCRRKAKCARCAGPHKTLECKVQNENLALCPYCYSTHEEGRSKCAYFKEVADSFNQQIKSKQQTRYTNAVASALKDVDQTNLHQKNTYHSNFPPLFNSYESLSIEDPLPSTSRNFATEKTTSSFASFPPPPTNIYASKKASSNQIINRSRSTSKRRRDGSMNTQQAPPTAKPSIPSVPIWPSNVSYQSGPSTQKSTSILPLKEIILTLVHNSAIDSIWIAVIEALIDPLLQAIMSKSSSVPNPNNG